LKIAKGYPEAVKKEGQCNDQKKKEKTMTLHTKGKSKQQGPYITQRLNSGDPQQ
jgi:hypothetical protein